MILSQVLTSCITAAKDNAEPFRPQVPVLVEQDGSSQVKIIDGSDIVYMRLEVWKRIVRYINETRPKDTPNAENIPIKNAITAKEDFVKILEK